MLGLTPDQSGYLIQSALQTLQLGVLVTTVWLTHSYLIRGLFKRARCHL
jgi:hypothetical protein